jgi:hypothetical protein
LRFVEGIFVFGFNCKLNQAFYIFSTLVKLVNSFDYLLKGDFLFAKCLCSVWLVPNIGAF